MIYNTAVVNNTMVELYIDLANEIKGKKGDKTLTIWGEIFLVRRAISLRWFIESLLKR